MRIKLSETTDRALLPKEANIVSAARLVFRWRVRAGSADTFQQDLLDLAVKFSSNGRSPKVIRPLELAETSIWALEVDFATHHDLGDFLDSACKEGEAAQAFLKAIHNLSVNPERVSRDGTHGVQPDSGTALVVSVVSVKQESRQTGSTG